MQSTASSVKPVLTTEEEEVADSPSYRYIPRTLQQASPFYDAAVQGNEYTDEPINTPDTTEFPRRFHLRRSKTTNEGRSNKNTQSRLYRSPTDFLRAQPYEDISNEQDSDRESVPSQSFPSTPASRLEDFDIKSIHGKDHYGKLETSPITDNQDKLWTQIDALDDVKKLANNSNLYENFPPGFEQQLSKLRHTHSQLLSMIRDRDALLEKDNNVEDEGMESTREYGTKINKPATATISHVDNRPDLNAVPSTASTTKSFRPNAKRRTSATSSAIRLEEDKCVQEMIDIIKQLRA